MTSSLFFLSEQQTTRMSAWSSFGRWLWGGDAACLGLHGKISQLAKSQPSVLSSAYLNADFKAERDQISTAICDVPLHPRYSGSVAVIFMGKVNCDTVCIKLVPNHVQRMMQDDYKLMQTLAYLGSSVNATLPKHIESFQRLLNVEMQMKNELRMTQILQSGLQGLCIPHVFQALRPLTQHCTDDVFVYHHVDGETLHECKDRQRRVVELLVVFFALLHQRGILLADVNPGNFVIGDDGTITILDAGGIVILSQTQRDVLAHLHATQGNRDKLEQAMQPLGELSTRLIDFMTCIMSTMWSPTPVSFANSPTLGSLLCDPEVLASKANPEYTLVFRACAQLARILSEYDSTFCVRDAMVAIDRVAGQKCFNHHEGVPSAQSGPTPDAADRTLLQGAGGVTRAVDANNAASIPSTACDEKPGAGS